VTPRTIGVMGGMGPAATVEFYRRLVSETPAERDQDHLHILIDNDPSVPDRTAALLHGGEDPGPALCRMARRLEAAGAEMLAMPCNTAHAYLDQIVAAVEIPVINMLAETAQRLVNRSAGVMATSGTMETGLYERALVRSGARYLQPDSCGQATVDRAIREIKRGVPPTEVSVALAQVVRALAAQGAEAVVAGCTELSLVNGTEMELPWVDALDVLVEATLREAWREGESVQP